MLRLLRAPAKSAWPVGRRRRRLIELLAQKDRVLREEIEAYLTVHLASAREVIARYLSQNSHCRDDIAAREQTEIILHRIIAQATPAQAR